MDRLVSRPYLHDDYPSCLSIFDSNVPKFFAPVERDQFAEFLQDLEATRSLYLVLTIDDIVVACGGLSMEAETWKASLSWGMVNRAAHHQRLGTRLTEERLKLARKSADISEVLLSTSQHTYGFYERHGFTVLKITPDGYATGLDRYDMTLRLV